MGQCVKYNKHKDKTAIMVKLRENFFLIHIDSEVRCYGNLTLHL